MVASFSNFYLSWILSEHSKTLFLRVFTSKPAERAQVLLNNGTKDFQNSPPFERSNIFNTLTLKQILWKTKTFFKKTGVPFFSTVETTEIENTFQFKTALSETNAKASRMAPTKWTYHEKWRFANNYVNFLENIFQFQNILKRFNLMYQQSK